MQRNRFVARRGPNPFLGPIYIALKLIAFFAAIYLAATYYYGDGSAGLTRGIIDTSDDGSTSTSIVVKSSDRKSASTPVHESADRSNAND